MFSGALIRINLRNPWVGIFLALLILVASAIGLRNTTMIPDIRVFFGQENPDKISLDQFETQFVREDSALIAITAKDGEIFTPQVIDAVADTVDSAWKLSYVRRVDSITNFQHSRVEDGTLVVSDLITDPRSVNPDTLNKARLEALSRPEIVGSILNNDSSATAVRVLFFMPGIDPRSEAPQVLGELQEIKSEIEKKHTAVKVHITGTVPMNANFTLAARKDLKTLVPIMLVMVILVVGIALQMASATGLILLMVTISAVTSIGILGWFRTPLNIATVMSPLIVMTLSVAAATHLLSAIRREMSASDMMQANREKRTSIVQQALLRHIKPITISLLTTIIGFLALNFSISPPFRQLGNSVAAGLFVTLLMTQTLLPALIILLPIKAPNQASRVQRWVEQIPSLLIRLPRLLWGGIFVLLLGIALAGISKLQLEDDFVAYFDHSFEFRQDTDYIEDKLTGLRVLEYPFHAEAASGIYEPDFLAEVDAFVEWLRKQPHVVSVQTPTDTLKRLVMNMNDDDPATYRLPSSKEEAAQFMLLYEMSLGYGMDLTDRIMLDKSGLRVSVVLRGVTTADTRILEANASKWIGQNTQRLKSEPTGIAHVFTLLAFRDAKAMLAGTALALLLISLGVMLVLRDWRLGIISLVPNLLPAILAFGLWGHIRGDVTLAISVVAAMTFGIVVDDTIHFLAEYSRQRKKGRSSTDAVNATFTYVGSAIVTTSIALLVGFGVMSMSGFAVNSDMALLTLITILFALLCDLILLPLLLIHFPGSTAKNVSINAPGTP